MLSSIATLAPPVPPLSSPETEEEIRRSIQGILWSTQAERRTSERRRERRFPYPFPIHVAPVDAAEQTAERSFMVIGRQLSHLGLDFYHRHPVAERRVVASFRFHSSVVSLLTDLTWCRYSRHGWYENGGRFLGPAPTPRNLPAW